MDIDSGIGIRIDDNHNDGAAEPTRDVTIDSVDVRGAGSHGVETYGVDGIDIGTVRTRDTGGCGLLLNATANASVEYVDAVRADEGGGYAGFRCANDAGPNITVERVDASSCGRGVFTVSGSSGITIRDVHLEGNGSGALIQDTRDTTIDGGTVTGNQGEGIRIDSRSSQTHPHTRDVTVRNLSIENNGSWGVRETGPGTERNAIRDNAFCNNGSGAVSTYAGSTTVTGNSYDCSGDPGGTSGDTATPEDPGGNDGGGDDGGSNGGGSTGGSTDPNATLVPSATSVSVGEWVTFQVEDATGSGAWLQDLQWSFGDGTTATGWWNAHRYESAGTYTVTLTATASDGTVTDHTVTVTVS